MRFFDYLLAQLKRIFKLLPGILAVNLVLLIVIGLVGYALVYNDKRTSEWTKYNLGIVGSTEDEMLKMGVYLLENEDDNSMAMLQLVEYDDKDEAAKALRQGEISAFVVIDDTFINSLNALTNGAKLTYYATSGERGITSVFMDEVADIASNMIVYSEKGILSMRDILKNAGEPAEIINSNVNELFLLYVSAILAREEMTEFNVIGESDSISSIDYYTITITLFYILMLTFCSVSFFLGRKKASYQFIASKGLGAGRQVLAEYISFFAVNAVCLFVINLVVKLAMAAFGHMANSSTDDATALIVTVTGAIIKSNINILVPLLLFTAMTFLIFEAISGIINKFMLGFIAYIGMSYVSGYFYPRGFFAYRIQNLGRILPTGTVLDYLAKRSTDEPLPLEILNCLMYFVLFILFAILIRRHRIKS